MLQRCPGNCSWPHDKLCFALQGNATEAQQALQKLTHAPGSGQAAVHNSSSHCLTILHSGSLSSCPAQHARALLLQARFADPQGVCQPPQDAVSIASGHAVRMQQRQQSHESASTSGSEAHIQPSRTRGRGAWSTRVSKQPPTESPRGAASSTQDPDIQLLSVLHKQAHLLLRAYDLSEGMPLLHRYCIIFKNTTIALCEILHSHPEWCQHEHWQILLAALHTLTYCHACA